MVYYIIFLLVLIVMRILQVSKNKTLRFFGFIGCFLFIIIFLGLKLGIQGILLNPICWIALIAIGIGVYIFVYKKSRNIIFSLSTYKDINYLERDLSGDYPPSVVSYLFNQDSSYRDLLADIMNLYARRIVNIKKNDKNEYIFYIEKEEKLKKIQNESDMYIVRTLMENKCNRKFDFMQWEKKVQDEALSNNFVNDEMIFSTKRAIIIGVIICILAIALEIKNFGFDLLAVWIGLLYGLVFSLIFISIFLRVINLRKFKHIRLSKEGKIELKKWIKFKRFIKKYTLIEDRSFEEIIIYEKYIPYAISLKINTKYKNTKFDIFDEHEINSIKKANSLQNYFERLGFDI